mmetsp:Transcript_20943/g.59771  ORF Transcript_20943/g.59771 Transcript_20943/m.59771 type:complete len:522 (+) Transcript_20943:274-1839(+)
MPPTFVLSSSERHAQLRAKPLNRPRLVLMGNSSLLDSQIQNTTSMISSLISKHAAARAELPKFVAIDDGILKPQQQQEQQQQTPQKNDIIMNHKRDVPSSLLSRNVGPLQTKTANSNQEAAMLLLNISNIVSQELESNSDCLADDEQHDAAGPGGDAELSQHHPSSDRVSIAFRAAATPSPTARHRQHQRQHHDLHPLLVGHSSSGAAAPAMPMMSSSDERSRWNRIRTVSMDSSHHPSPIPTKRIKLVPQAPLTPTARGRDIHSPSSIVSPLPSPRTPSNSRGRPVRKASLRTKAAAVASSTHHKPRDTAKALLVGSGSTTKSSARHQAAALATAPAIPPSSAGKTATTAAAAASCGGSGTTNTSVRRHAEKALELSITNGTTLKKILRKKFSWKNYPELEAFLIANREEYLRHSALNYTVQQKQYNNRLTELLLDLAAEHGYVFDEADFSFVTVRDRIRCYFKSYVQSAKKRGIIIGYAARKAGLLSEEDLERSAQEEGHIVMPADAEASVSACAVNQA